MAEEVGQFGAEFAGMEGFFIVSVAGEAEGIKSVAFAAGKAPKLDFGIAFVEMKAGKTTEFLFKAGEDGFVGGGWLIVLVGHYPEGGWSSWHSGSDDRLDVGLGGSF